MDVYQSMFSVRQSFNQKPGNYFMFRDRFEAGELLAEKLAKYRKTNAIILVIPRGALQVGKILHEKLELPLDIIMTKKIPHPHNPEFAIGAVNMAGNYILNSEITGNIAFGYINEQKKKLAGMIKERYVKYCGSAKLPDLEGKIVIIVDDGVATGSTIISAIGIVRKQKPKKIVVAIPVGPPHTIEKIKKITDEVICLLEPEDLMAIGQFYEDFSQVEDEEAIAILRECRKNWKRSKV